MRSHRGVGLLSLVGAVVAVLWSTFGGLSKPLRATGDQPILQSISAKVFFSPRGGATEAVLEVLEKAQHEVLVQAYSFTSAPIAQALKLAHERGVKIRVILDKSQRSERYTSATFLVRAGIPVWIDASHTIAHNKVMIIDGAQVITGSFNFTKAAEERNAENLLVLTDSRLAGIFTQNWNAHLAHAEVYPSR